jgi:hypothetical protein
MSATEDRTQPGKTGPVLNYLGRPCQFAKLVERHTDATDHNWLEGKDQRWLTQHLGDKLGELDKRTSYMHALLERLARVVDDFDRYELESVVDVLRTYAFATSNLAYETTTVAIATLDSAGLIAASQQQRAEVPNA